MINRQIELLKQLVDKSRNRTKEDAIKTLRSANILNNKNEFTEHLRHLNLLLG